MGCKTSLLFNSQTSLASLADRLLEDLEQAYMHTHSCRPPRGRALKSMASNSEFIPDMAV